MSAAYRPPLHTYLTRPILRGVCRFLFHVLGRVQITGVENVPRGQPYVAVLNHVSIIDPPALLSFWPETMETIGAVDVFARPFQGQLASLYGVIPVHRGEYDRALISKVLALLKAGYPLMMAPEGGRSHVTAMRRAKPGIGFILQRADVPIVPAGLVGTTGDFIQRGLHGERPLVEIRIGKPVHLPPALEGGAARRDARQQIADLVMSYVAGLLPEEYRGVYADTAIFPAN